MEKFKGTPGPWKINKKYPHYEYDKYYHIVAGDGFLNQTSKGFGLTACIGDADAQLISAAPDLLKALQLILPHAELIINNNHPSHKKAILAINKALNIKG